MTYSYLLFTVGVACIVSYKAHQYFENTLDPKMSGRTIKKVVLSKWQSEGRGARVRRSIGRAELSVGLKQYTLTLRNLDPFLLLDEFEGNSLEGAGFPDHPHRGFETVSYLLEGHFTHEDFSGNKGTLGPGDLQWMTAGRGIVHSEMPGPVKTRGLQLWVNLAREFKMVSPAYQELSASEIPSAEQDGVRVKVIAGESMGIKSLVRTRTPVYYLDFTLAPGAQYQQTIPGGWTSFVYILEGKCRFNQGDEAAIDAHNTVVFNDDGDSIVLKNAGAEMAHLVLVSGRPIGEPVAQMGPFVMCTQQELQQAIHDFQNGLNGFENAKSWKSVEGNR